MGVPDLEIPSVFYVGNKAINALLIVLGCLAAFFVIIIVISNVFVDIHNYNKMEFFEKQYNIRLTPFQKLMVCWKCQAKNFDYPELEAMFRGWGLIA